MYTWYTRIKTVWLLFSTTCQFQLQFNQILRSTAHPFRIIVTHYCCWIYSNVCPALLGITYAPLWQLLPCVAFGFPRFPRMQWVLASREWNRSFSCVSLFFIDFRVFAFSLFAPTANYTSIRGCQALWQREWQWWSRVKPYLGTCAAGPYPLGVLYQLITEQAGIEMGMQNGVTLREIMINI